jgi:O-antigen/teichoic acid export membrane protein
MTDSTPLVQQQNNKKLGHRVFCCCDSRKATILVSLVALILNIIFLIGYATGNHANSIWAIVVYSISILFYLLVIFGAIRYHRCAVIISLIWQLVAVVLIIIGTIQFDWSSVSGDTKTQDIIAVTVALIWYLVVIYSLGTFVREVSNGIMSPATHSREKYACCCNV